MLSSRKTWFQFIMVVVLSFGVVGCSFFFDEKKKEDEVSYDQEVGSCLGQSNSLLVSYFDGNSGTISHEGIDQFSDCYVESLESFIKHTKSGRLESDDYSAENIESLIQRFHPGQGISADRLRGYIRLKSFLIGGAEETLSKEELIVLQKIVPMVAKSLKSLLPYRKILLQQVELSASREDYLKYDKAVKQLRRQVKQLVGVLEKYKGSRRVNIEEVAQFFFSEFYKDRAEDYYKYLSLIVSFKNFAVDEEGIQLKRSNFATFIDQALSTYDALTRFNYFLLDDEKYGIFKNIGHVASFIARIPSQLENAQIFKGVSLRALDDILNTANGIMTKALRERPERTMKLIKVSDILYALEEAEKIKAPLTAKTLSLYLRNFIKKWFDPSRPMGSLLTMGKVNYVNQMVDRWFERQQIVNTLFERAKADSISLTKYQKSLPKNKALKEWVTIIQKVGTHQWDEKRRVNIGSEMSEFSYEELTVSNSITLLSEIFMKPYNLNESSLLNYKITDLQTEEIYELNRVIGVELAFMDSRIDDSGIRAFREMNSFSTQGSSDDYMDLYEGYEYLSFAFSAGELSDRIYNEIPTSCHKQAIDVLGKNVLKKECFQSHLRTHFADYFSHLPTVYRYWLNANNLQKDEFLGALEISSRAGTIREKGYDLAEIRTAVSILSFLEAIFYMFDTKKINDLVDGEESLKGQSELRRAEAHFRPLITYFVKQYKPGLIKEYGGMFQKACGGGRTDEQLLDCIAPKLFIHLLRTGSLPLKDTDYCGKIAFWFLLDDNKEEMKFKETKADAGEVLKVFSAIAKITWGGHVKRVQQFLLNKQGDLLNSLQGATVPDCQQNRNNVFCKWSRLIYCTDSVNQNVFDEFRYNRSNWFDEDLYEQSPDEAVEQSMIEIYNIFGEHDLYSTLCAFPTVRKSKRVDPAVSVVRDCGLGQEEEPGITDHVKQISEDVGEKAKELWNSWMGD